MSVHDENEHEEGKWSAHGVYTTPVKTTTHIYTCI